MKKPRVAMINTKETITGKLYEADEAAAND